MNIPYKFNPMGISNSSLDIENPFCITAINNLYVRVNGKGSVEDPNLLYSLDDGKSWSSYTIGTDINLASGDSVLLYGQSGRWSTSGSNYLTISISSTATLSGDLSSLINYQLLNDNYTFYALFNRSSVYDASLLILPWGVLTDSCFLEMFYYCGRLKWAPALPASYLASSCYCGMFGGCTNLFRIPDLNAINLADRCYMRMFMDCTTITLNKLLPATKLPNYCYYLMFLGCKNLTNVTDLNATSLSDGITQYYGMFENCTSLVTAPELSATTLSDNCYISMFQGCTSLVTAPELPATTLASDCYRLMFLNCSKLNYVKVNFTNWGDGTSTANWLYGVAANGTFDAPSELPIIYDASHIPINWDLPNHPNMIIAESQMLLANINTLINYQIIYTIIPPTLTPSFAVNGQLPNGLSLTEDGHIVGSVSQEGLGVISIVISAEGCLSVTVSINYSFIDAITTTNDLTANDSNPEYTVSQRSTYGSDYAYYAMDGDDWTYSKTQYSSTEYDWWMIDFHLPTMIYAIDIDLENLGNKRMHFEGSNDGGNWDKIKTYMNGQGHYTVDIDCNTAYRYYRFICEVKYYYLKIHLVYFTYKKVSTPDVNDVQSFKITNAENLDTSLDEYMFFVGYGDPMTPYTYSKQGENYFVQTDYLPITLAKQDNEWVFSDWSMMGVELRTTALNPFDPNATWYRLMDRLNNNIKLTFLLVV